MPPISVSRSQVIEASIEHVFEEVRDFRRWPKWSPWLIADPEADLVFADEEYSWEGRVCGAGSMVVTGEVEHQSITYDLQFLKPFKSRAKVKILFEKKGEGTLVTWSMDSSLPFFLFWMTKSMEGFIGMDYERGLLMLKDLVEKGEVNSRLNFRGQESFHGFTGVGKRNSCSIDAFEDVMEADYQKVREHFPDGEGFCVYHDWNIVKRSMTYVIGVKVNDAPEKLSDGLELVNCPLMDIYVVRHHGDLKHLGNAWSGGMSHMRAKLFKASKKFPPFEFYEELEDDSGVVKVCFPMK